MIDIDVAHYVEYEDGTKVPIALIETAQDIGQEFKTATVTKNLAKAANIPCCVLLYKHAQTRNPFDPKWPDIESFRYRRLWPEPPTGWKFVTPNEWANILLRIRRFGAAALGFDAPSVAQGQESVDVWRCEECGELVDQRSKRGAKMLCVLCAWKFDNPAVA